MPKSVFGWARIGLLVLAAAVVLVVMFQNTGQDMKLLFDPRMPAWLGVFIVTMVGFVSGLLASTYLWTRVRRRARSRDERDRRDD